MQFWLLKTEPEEYSIEMMMDEKITKWDSVKNYQAQKYLKAMKIGDNAFFYHTGKEKAIVGVVKVHKEFYHDDDPKFGLVDVAFYKAFDNKISLNTIKNNLNLKNMTTLKQPRLSVSSVTESEWNEILKLSEDKK